MSKKQNSKPQSTVSVPLSSLISAKDVTPDMSRDVILLRIQQNIQETKHPFHHMTVDGTIVDADPTLEYLISKLTDAPTAIPVNRTYYGFDPYEES